MIRKGAWRRGVAALALISGLVPFTAGTAQAASPAVITCTAAGTVVFTNSTTDTWSVAGRGACQGDNEGTYFLDFIGSGTSTTLGLCDTGLVVQDLDIQVVSTLTNAATLLPKVFTQNWVAPVTTYPLATPFAITDGGNPVGAGNFFNHIYLNCSGSPVAQFEWAFLV